jgi:hypothetical protein
MRGGDLPLLIGQAVLLQARAGRLEDLLAPGFPALVGLPGVLRGAGVSV